MKVKEPKYCPNCGSVIRGKGKYCSYQCSFPVMREVIEQLITKHGPYYQKWKIRWQAATGLKLKGD